MPSTDESDYRGPEFFVLGIGDHDFVLPHSKGSGHLMSGTLSKNLGLPGGCSSLKVGYRPCTEWNHRSIATKPSEPTQLPLLICSIRCSKSSSLFPLAKKSSPIQSRMKAASAA